MLEVTYIKNTMYPSGKYYYTCPGCGGKSVFFMYQSEYECIACGEKLPDVKQMLVNAEERLDYHFSKGEDE